MVALAICHRGDELDRALDHMLHLGQGGLNHRLELGKCLGRLHPVIAHSLKAFGHHVLDHPANKREDIDGLTLHSFTAVRAVMIGDVVAIIAIDAPDRDRWRHHVLGFPIVLAKFWGLRNNYPSPVCPRAKDGGAVMTCKFAANEISG